MRDPGRGAERNIRRLAFKYVLIDDEFYCRTAEDLLLKCLDSDHARVAMSEVHKGFCGTHQSAPKMKWLLRRAGLRSGLEDNFGSWDEKQQVWKWSPSWEGPYKIIKVISGNSYMVETVQGERLPKAINGRYLKKFYPSVWQSA